VARFRRPQKHGSRLQRQFEAAVRSQTYRRQRGFLHAVAATDLGSSTVGAEAVVIFDRSRRAISSNAKKRPANQPSPGGRVGSRPQDRIKS